MRIFTKKYLVVSTWLTRIRNIDDYSNKKTINRIMWFFILLLGIQSVFGFQRRNYGFVRSIGFILRQLVVFNNWNWNRFNWLDFLVIAHTWHNAPLSANWDTQSKFYLPPHTNSKQTALATPHNMHTWSTRMNSGECTKLPLRIRITLNFRINR